MSALVSNFDNLLDDAKMLMDPPQRLSLHTTLARGLVPNDPVRKLM